MNTQENLLNSEAQKCSFCEDDIENMCSNKEYDTCGDCLFAVKGKIKALNHLAKLDNKGNKQRLSGLQVGCRKLEFKRDSRA